MALDADRTRAIIAAREAAPLSDFRDALVHGRLVVCGNCSRFQFGADPAAEGHCGHFGVEAFPFAPFYCSGFEVSTTPAAAAFLPNADDTREVVQYPERG